jgi:PleD family two-component response regulator
MEISDQRYQELLASIGIRQGGNDRVHWAGQPARTQAPSIATQIETKQIEYPADPATAPISVAREVKDILLVDPDVDGLRAARNALSLVADVEACSEFRAARTRLLARPPDLLVTNVRLRAYNGLHLVYLTEGTATRSIVYGTEDDLVLAREVKEAGAFYERSRRLPRALVSYVHAVLPPRDRRDPGVLDRRRILRGGRRCTDL